VKKVNTRWGLERVGSVTAAATATATTAVATTTTAAVTTAATAVATATAAITAATTAATGLGFVDANHPVHPFDVLEIVDGLLFFGIIGQFDKGKTALTAGFPVEGQAALANFSVLTEKVTEILLFGVERKVAYVDCHVTGKKLELIRRGL
jgi:hypothetical protein